MENLGSGSVRQHTTLVDLLQHRAFQQPDQLGFRFLTNGTTQEEVFSYAALDRKARAIATSLQTTVPAGERAVLLYSPGLEYIAAFFGCLYAGVIAVPAYPPRSNQLSTRLTAIVQDSQARLALTTTATLATLTQRHEHQSYLDGLSWITTDTISDDLAEDWRAPDLRDTGLVFLQYTSGSTSDPKGVMLSHRNLLHNLAQIEHAFKHTSESHAIIWLPPYHDMGLIGGILQPLYTGYPVTLLSPTTFLQRPIRWLQAISRYGGTTSGGPDFAYDLCARRITDEQRAELDLSGWNVAFSGAEPVRAETIERFSAAFASCGFQRTAFYPCYGLAEATLFVSGGLPSDAPVLHTVLRESLDQPEITSVDPETPHAQTFVSCGRAAGDQQIVIVDPATGQRCPEDRVGEIWVSGPSIAQGYWNRPETTSATFHNTVADTGQGPFLRTGDLGFLHQGELFVTGRAKDLIIIRGVNHYPQDIELTAERSHPALQPHAGAAVSVETQHAEQLVIVQEVTRNARNIPADEMMTAIREAVAIEHGLDVYAVVLIKAGSIPKTSSGKIQRFACRQGFLDGSLIVVAAWSRDLAQPTTPAADHDAQVTPTADPARSPEVDRIRSWLVTRLATRLHVAPQQIDSREPFARYGLDSAAAIGMAGELEEWLNRELSPTLIYEYPTIDALAQYLAGNDRPESDALAGGSTDAIEKIAIIGIGCRFPGSADSPTAFWQALCQGVDAIAEVPSERWNIDAVYDPNAATPGKMNTRWAGLLPAVDQFDPDFFSISPREAICMDPQQRLLLEVAWEALEDAGIARERLLGSQAGVFIGIAGSDYAQLQLRDSALSDAYVGTGSALSIAANRLSYFLDLSGPSIAIDTACSSSLVAVQLACQSLQRGETALALAGGVNLILSPAITINFTKAGFMAPDGRCKAFDAAANGYVRGEGAGVVVLKRLSAAIADGDPIYAVICGGAVNNDGHSNGLTAPSRQAQEAVLREAYRRSGVAPGEIDYIEAHGTGTALGDPIEAKALGAVVGAARTQPCSIGSVKTNIGHLEAAAGIAGLIKVALSLKHGAIPPTLHFQQPNPLIPFDELHLSVQQQLSPWPAERAIRRAGVSSFGFGGTNAHLVLESAPEPQPQAHRSDPAPHAYLLPLSARTPAALHAAAAALHAQLMADRSNPPTLQDVCYTASRRRSHHDERLALVGRTHAEIVGQLEAVLQGTVAPGLSRDQRVPGTRPRIAFVFPGQGGQWIGMGRELLRQAPSFRAAVEACDQALRQYVAWSVLAAIEGDESIPLDTIDVIQPVLFTIQIGLVALWKSWGVQPDAVVGHSMGEVAAAYVSGALSLDAAARIICRRSSLLRRISGHGAMVMVDLSFEEAQQILAGYEDLVSVAVSNSPTSTVLSGDQAALTEISARLSRAGIFWRWVKVDVASHSPQVEPIRADLLAALGDLRPQAAAVPMYSTVTNTICAGPELDADYWWRNLRSPVRFAVAVEQLIDAEHQIFLEINPHPILVTAVEQGLQARSATGLALPSLRREQPERLMLLSTCGALYTSGVAIDWSALSPAGRCVPLPTYPWQRQRYWLDQSLIGADGAQAAAPTAGPGRHLYLGQPLQSAAHPGTSIWEFRLDRAGFPYLNDHQIHGQVVLPAAAYLEMALTAADSLGNGTYAVSQFTFQRFLTLPETGFVDLQVIITEDMPGTATCRIFSSQDQTSSQSRGWLLHASGTLHMGQTRTESALTISLETIQQHSTEVVLGADHYRALAARGLQYGPEFQGVVQIWQHDSAALARIHPTPDVRQEHSRYQIHPALLDSCLQTLAAAIPASHAAALTDTTYVPVSLERLQIYQRPDPQGILNAYAHLHSETGHDQQIAGDVLLLDQDGQTLLHAQGVRLQPLKASAAPATSASPQDWLYAIDWRPYPRTSHTPRPGPVAAGTESWLILADSGGVGVRLRSLLTAHGVTTWLALPTAPATPIEQYSVCDPSDPQAFRDLLLELGWRGIPPVRSILHLWSLDAATEPAAQAPLGWMQSLVCDSVLHLVQAITEVEPHHPPQLWLVSRGVQPIAGRSTQQAVAQAPLWGFGRTIMHEHPELRCALVDLGTDDAPDELEALVELCLHNDDERQIALRGAERYAARLVRSSPATMALPSSGLKPTTTDPATAYRLEIPTPGILDGLTLRPVARRMPGPGEVEIKVAAAGLNFRDVLKAMGMYPGQSDQDLMLGDECSGTITACGAGVDGIEIGAQVIAIAPGSLGTFVTVPAEYVLPLPARLSFEAAATIPIAYATAAYALCHLAKLQQGERVLIHAASGGVGLAAIRIAQWLGAEIFATAGSPEKRAFVESLGVRHVMDSRSLAFADEVQRETGGQGVDVVLNSLSGDAMTRSMAILAPYGRYVEIGKRDIYQNSQIGLWPFHKNLAYFAVDLARLFRDRPALARSIFQQVAEQIDRGVLPPLPYQEFSLSDAQSAFRLMAQAQHIGKIVVRPQPELTAVEDGGHTAPMIQADATYLITGGLGGLGLKVAQWLVAEGARSLVLAGRSAPSASAANLLAELEQAGARVTVASVDVAQSDQVARLIVQIGHDLPPLRGVIHAAGILDDTLIAQLDRQRIGMALAPKAAGAWNLHIHTLALPLDMFVLFSSAAALLGSPGQANYAAANAFLDTLAHYRHSLGLPALSINWGPWSEIGLAARPDRSGRLEQRGIQPLSPAQGIEALAQVIRTATTQVGVIPLNLSQWRQSYPGVAAAPFFAEILQADRADPAQQSAVRVALQAAEPGPQRWTILEEHLRQEIAHVLRLTPNRIDARAPLSSLGFDSLMALELRNRLELSLSLSLSATLIWSYPTIEALVPYLAQQMEIPLTPSDPEPAPEQVLPEELPQVPDTFQALLDEIAQLSDDDVQRLLTR